MKKILKIICIIVLALLLMSVMTSNISKQGWRLWGFIKCENPDEVYVDNVYVTDDSVHISGGTFSSALKYKGYIYKVIDESLYVGVRYGLFKGDGAAFSFEIEADFSRLKNVFLTNGKEELNIWNLEKDIKYKSKIKSDSEV